MIKIDKGNVHIEGESTDIIIEFILGLKDLLSIMNNNGLDNGVLLGAIFSGLYNIKGEKGHKDCYNLGKFIDYKCRDYRNRGDD